MSYDWYNGTISVDVPIDDLLGELIDYLSGECVAYLPFSHNGRNYSLSIIEDRGPVPDDKVVQAIDAIKRWADEICEISQNASEIWTDVDRLAVRDKVSAIKSLSDGLKNEWFVKGVKQ